MIYTALSPFYTHSLPEGHRFPMIKYTLIPEQLILEGTFTKRNFFEPKLTGEDFISLVHSTDYIQRVKHKKLTALEERRMGFPLNDELIKRESLICVGNTQAALLALENGIAFNGAGGTHHAHKDFGEGYCMFNDSAVASQYLLNI